MTAEDWIKGKWPHRVRGDDLILDEREHKLPETRTKPETGETYTEEVTIGVVRMSIPIVTLADHFRKVIEDDTTYPEKRKKRDGLRQLNVNPDGTVKIDPEVWDRLLKEALG